MFRKFEKITIRWYIERLHVTSIELQVNIELQVVLEFNGDVMVGMLV